MQYANTQHRYNALDEYLKSKYQSKVFKVALNGDFSCPNRDGTISKDGCIFCSEKGSGDFAGDKADSLTIQFKMVKDIIHQKWPKALYIAYFQANTNTYAPLDKLKNLFEEAINLDPNIVVISIATRPDCLDDEIIAYLSDLNKRIPVWIELGLQSIHEKTAKFINRGYTLQVFNNVIIKLNKANIDVIIHIINGLPYETKDMMLETVQYLNQFKIQGIKIHSLFVLKNTILGKMYENKPFKMLTLAKYVDIVCEQLAILNSDVIIHRVNGDAPRELLIAPLWSLKKLVVMNEIDKEMKLRNYYQGCKQNNKPIS